jgi:hypothetical protein
MGTRLLKWVGAPPVLKSDGWSVANWRYENHRPIAVPGKTERIIEPVDRFRDERGRHVVVPNGLKRTYHWHRHLPNFVLEVDEDDARIILTREPHEFRDVTDVADPSKVTNTPRILTLEEERAAEARQRSIGRQSAGASSFPVPPRMPPLGSGRG